MDINISGAYIYFKIPILGGINVTQTMLSVLIVTVTLCIAAVILGKNLQKRPDGRQVLVEKGVTMLMNLVSSTMGAHNLRWVPYLGTIFLSSLAGSFVGLLGFTRSTTADLSVPLTWGVMTSVVIWAQSIKQNGFFLAYFFFQIRKLARVTYSKLVFKCHKYLPPLCILIYFIL